ncbi:MAG TPA: hypothetical protein VJK52_01915 [Candidatus Nanoarchaeia archaeon]|nr:hypothetical protein [Candidatus Nanoarchaeia archaeon]
MNCGPEDCCGSEGRKFLTAEEKIDRLGKYKDWLDQESKGVQEAMQKLKAK